MDPLEVAGGWVNGYDPDPLPACPDPDPRRVLHGILRRHLTRSPCMVAFSGGRDSSVLLAAAAAVARTEGLPMPVAVTLSYPGAPATDEACWQQQVLDHVGITERVVLTVHDEHDAIGPIATSVLARHGLLWPPNFTPTWRMLNVARGGTLLTGENGDEVFGLKRITPITKILATRGRADRRVYPHAVRAVAPAALRRRSAERTRYRRGWLHEPVERELARRDSADVVAASLHAGRHAWQLASRRAVRRADETMRGLAAEVDSSYVQPFGEPEFVAAVAAAAGFWGWSGRTATMRRLFGDLLPRAVLERRTKADFTEAVLATHTRTFAQDWDGTGVDTTLVDPEALRRSWLSSRQGPTMALLQQAWLAGVGASR
jgi:asparagine synthase (glutamine-hydrolysing)